MTFPLIAGEKNLRGRCLAPVTLRGIPARRHGPGGGTAGRTGRPGAAAWQACLRPGGPLPGGVRRHVSAGRAEGARDRKGASEPLGIVKPVGRQGLPLVRHRSWQDRLLGEPAAPRASGLERSIGRHPGLPQWRRASGGRTARNPIAGPGVPGYLDAGAGDGEVP
jgi:hypothetical protein